MSFLQMNPPLRVDFCQISHFSWFHHLNICYLLNPCRITKKGVFQKYLQNLLKWLSPFQLQIPEEGFCHITSSTTHCNSLGIETMETEILFSLAWSIIVESWRKSKQHQFNYLLVQWQKIPEMKGFIKYGKLWPPIPGDYLLQE